MRDEKGKWQFTAEDGSVVEVRTDELFDAEAFCHYLFSERLCMTSKPDKSSTSNSHYIQVTTYLDDRETEETATFMVSDHAARGHFSLGLDLDAYFDDMSQSARRVWGGAHDGWRWENIPGVTWNRKDLWDAAIAKLDKWFEKMNQEWKERKEEKQREQEEQN
jgi:hypothetical protein